jgi:hypothetical protein
MQKVFASRIKRVQACIRGRSWTSLPTHFVIAQRLSERLVCMSTLRASAADILRSEDTEEPFADIVRSFVQDCKPLRYTRS